jgi:hypothetical protein
MKHPTRTLEKNRQPQDETMTRTLITLTALLLAPSALPAAETPPSDAPSRIHRQAPVTRTGRYVLGPPLLTGTSQQRRTGQRFQSGRLDAVPPGNRRPALGHGPDGRRLGRRPRQTRPRLSR